MKPIIYSITWRKTILLSLVSFCFFIRLNATVITVCPSGCGYTTIAAAMAAASSGDTILLNVSGVYTEKNITVPEKNLVLRGLGKTVTILQSAAARADGTNGGRIFTRPAPSGAGGNYFIVEDMTIRNAYAPLVANQSNGGVLLATGSLKGMITKFNRVKFYANETTPGNTNNSGGACVYVSATGSTVPYNAIVESNDCDFDDNKVGNSSGSSLSDGPCFNILGSPALLTINNCTFTNNNGYTRGGVIYAGAGWTINISNSMFGSNTCRNGDGGCFHGRSGIWTIENCLFKNNSAVFVSAVNGNNGYGGVFMGGGAKFKNCTFYNNSAVMGGAILRSFNGTGVTADMHLINCTLHGNSASSKGKSIYYGTPPPSTSAASLPLIMVNTIVTNGGGAAATEIQFNHPYSNFSTNIKSYCNSIGNDVASPGTTPVFDFTSVNTPLLGLSSTLVSTGGSMEALPLTALSPMLNAGTNVAGGIYSIPIKDQRNYSRFDLGIDVGSYELNGIIDISDEPIVAYAPLTNTLSIANRTLSVAITDLNGVYWFGNQVPRIYFKKGTGGTWFSTAGSLTAGNGLIGTWNFTIDNSLMGGVTTGDQIFYYVVAGDVSTSVHFNSNPLGVVLAADINVILSAPSGPANYFISNLTLPVSLLSFTASVQQKDVLLNWKAADAVNFSHFEIERSADGRSFTTIGQQPAAPGSGDKQYSFIDANALINASANGKLYYRLKMVDIDNKSKYSQVVQVIITADKKSFVISTQPNPFIDRISINLQLNKAELVTIRLSDIKGNLVRKTQQMAQAGFSSQSLNDLSSLTPGVYMLEIIKGNESIKEKIVKP